MKQPDLVARRSIPVAQPVLAGNEMKYVRECLETGWISSIGKFVSRFEDSFAQYCRADFGVSCSSGTSALHLALAALGIGPGDEVIVPTLTYIASANAVRYCGAEPVFIDSEPRTMTLDPELLASCLTPRTKGIVAVHLYGHPADMDPINEFAARHGLFVIEDAAEAHGALYRGRVTGSLGAAAAFSFYGNKIVTTGEGGMVTTSDAGLRDRMRLLRGQGMDPQRRYWFPEVGYNYRMTNVAAAIGLAQMEQIDSFLHARRQAAQQYAQQLARCEEFLIPPSVQSWATHAFWSYTVVLRDTAPLGRDELMARLGEDGIDTRPAFYPMHVLPPYRRNGGGFPVAERLGRNGISLPMHGSLSAEDIEWVAARIGYWCRQRAASA